MQLQKIAEENLLPGPGQFGGPPDIGGPLGSRTTKIRQSSERTRTPPRKRENTVNTRTKKSDNVYVEDGSLHWNNEVQENGMPVNKFNAIFIHSIATISLHCYEQTLPL